MISDQLPGKKELPQGNKLPIIVIGASAGGLNALIELVSQLDADLHAAIFIVLHLSEQSVGDYLVYQLQPHTSFICKLALDNEMIEDQTIYIAAPGRHLLIKGNETRIGHGPKENRWRPSIDVLFRSAAANHGSSVIGIILTGLLDDGTAGMLAIHKSGGICIVQDPNEAEFPDMPLSVLSNMEVDYCVSLSIMNKTISDSIHKVERSEAFPIPKEVIAEAAISEKVAAGIPAVQQLGQHSVFICPDCGGGLWEITDDKTHRYRCHIGHSYSERDLNKRQAETIESTLWMALRMMEERKNFMVKIARQHKQKGLAKMAALYDKKVDDISFHISRMKEVLFDAQKETDN
jgi:two-component system chemotaxis response regulator CheB